MKTIFTFLLIAAVAYLSHIHFKNVELESKIQVLFIGNSYTMGLDKMLTNISEGDPQIKTKINAESITIGGAGLKQLWENPETHKKITDRHWDYIILQERSLWAAFPKEVQDSFALAPSWNEKLKQHTSKVLFFATWARKPESSWYKHPDTSFLKNAREFQLNLDDKAYNLSKLLGAEPIYVGNYWMRTLFQNPSMPLYAPDDSHPSVTGTYFTALIFYRYISGSNLSEIIFVPQETSPENAQILKNIAVTYGAKPSGAQEPNSPSQSSGS